MNKAVRNERRKLSATYINGLAVAMLALGGISQAIAFAQSTALSAKSALVAIVCILGSVGLHWMARYLLGGLEE